MKSKAVVVNQNGEFLGALPNRTLVLLSSLAAIAMGLTFCGLPLISLSLFPLFPHLFAMK